MKRKRSEWKSSSHDKGGAPSSPPSLPPLHRVPRPLRSFMETSRIHSASTSSAAGTTTSGLPSRSTVVSAISRGGEGSSTCCLHYLSTSRHRPSGTIPNHTTANKNSNITNKGASFATAVNYHSSSSLSSSSTFSSSSSSSSSVLLNSTTTSSTTTTTNTAGGYIADTGVVHGNNATAVRTTTMDYCPPMAPANRYPLSSPHLYESPPPDPPTPISLYLNGSTTSPPLGVSSTSPSISSSSSSTLSSSSSDSFSLSSSISSSSSCFQVPKPIGRGTGFYSNRARSGGSNRLRTFPTCLNPHFHQSTSPRAPNEPHREPYDSVWFPSTASLNNANCRIVEATSVWKSLKDLRAAGHLPGSGFSPLFYLAKGNLANSFVTSTAPPNLAAPLSAPAGRGDEGAVTPRQPRSVSSSRQFSIGSSTSSASGGSINSSISRASVHAHLSVLGGLGPSGCKRAPLRKGSSKPTVVAPSPDLSLPSNGSASQSVSEFQNCEKPHLKKNLCSLHFYKTCIILIRSLCSCWMSYKFVPELVVDDDDMFVMAAFWFRLWALNADEGILLNTTGRESIASTAPNDSSASNKRRAAQHKESRRTINSPITKDQTGEVEPEIQTRASVAYNAYVAIVISVLKAAVEMGNSGEECIKVGSNYFDPYIRILEKAYDCPVNDGSNTSINHTTTTPTTCTCGCACGTFYLLLNNSRIPRGPSGGGGETDPGARVMEAVHKSLFCAHILDFSNPDSLEGCDCAKCYIENCVGELDGDSPGGRAQYSIGCNAGEDIRRILCTTSEAGSAMNRSKFSRDAKIFFQAIIANTYNLGSFLLSTLRSVMKCLEGGSEAVNRAVSLLSIGLLDPGLPTIRGFDIVASVVLAVMYGDRLRVVEQMKKYFSFTYKPKHHEMAIRLLKYHADNFHLVSNSRGRLEDILDLLHAADGTDPPLSV